uniref:DNA polymerase n=1 Tax=Trichuris muris TaxID=70415 RepID=A0A5S6QJ12_TRIMR
MFSGETFYLFPESVIRSRVKIFKEQVEQNDGAWCESPDSNVTIALLDDELEEDVLEVLCCKSKSLIHAKLLRLSWLVDCLKRKTKLDTSSYEIQFPASRKHHHWRASARPNREDSAEDSPPQKQPKDEPSDTSEYESSSLLSEVDEKNLASDKESTPEKQHESSNPNQAIIEQLEVLASGYRSVNDKWRTYAYENAISAIKKCDHPIRTSEDLRAVRGVGKRIAEKIEDFWEHGSVEKIDEFKTSERLQTLGLFNSIWGVGPVTSEQWYREGLRTLEDVRKKAKLTHQQEVGLKYRDEFLETIPRNEVAQLGRIVRDEVNSVDEHYVLELCGSYRREEPFSGDVDILITHPDGKSHRKILPLIVQRLSNKGCFTDNLTEQKRDVHKYMGVCRLPEEGSLHRRIDILAVPFAEFPTALLYNTGSAQFVRLVNARAKSMGMRLNMHGLREDVKREGGRVVDRGRRVEVHNEEDIFRHLSMKYRPPKNRNTF